MKDVYICNTYYHILIAITKTLVYKTKSDIYIILEPYEKTVINEKIIKNLKKSKIFDDIKIINFRKYYFKTGNPFINTYRKFIWIKAIKNIEFNQSLYKDIFIFNDSTSFGKLLNDKKIYYCLLEDGQDCYKTKPRDLEHKIKKVIKKLLKTNLPRLASSNYIKYIEVNNDENLWIDNKKTSVFQKKKLFNQLDSGDLFLLFQIFEIDNIDLDSDDEYVLVLTQPLEECLGCNEKVKVDIYRNLIEEFSEINEKVIIKPHPRENTIYSRYFQEYTILQSGFPIELLYFCNKIKFKRALTIKSTSIDSLPLESSNKITVGLEWAENIMKRDK